MAEREVTTYRVKVWIGDYGYCEVTVTADSPADAKAEAEELVKAATIEATYVWDADGNEVRSVPR